MDYRIKALIQNAISKLPDPLSYKVYYFFQKKFGNLKNINPKPQLLACKKIVEILKKLGHETNNKAFRNQR